jgi:protein O-mannosyl-transferase
MIRLEVAVEMFKRKPFKNRTAFDHLMASLPSRGVLAGTGILALAAFIAYLPSMNGGFVFDDNLLLTKNDLVRSPDGLRRLWCTTEAVDYWPATNSAFWLQWQLWGMNPTGYHLTNVILHVIESLLIWTILRRLSIPGAFLAAMLFALHPVNAESVAWISSLKNGMAMLFLLLSIVWYLKCDMPVASAAAPQAEAIGRLATTATPESARHRCSTGRCLLPAGRCLFWYGMSLTAFVLTMLSKGSAIVLPGLLLGILWWRRPLTRADFVRLTTFFFVAIILAGVNVWFQTHGKDIVIRNASFTERLLDAGGVIWFYVYKTVLPVDLSFIYPQWRTEIGAAQWWLPLLAAIVVTVALWWFRGGWSRPLFFAWGFFCVSLVPVMGFTDVGFMKYSLVADHYQHIAMIGLIALVAAGWHVWHKRSQSATRKATVAVAVALIAAFSFLTWRQSELYHDPIHLYQATLTKNPDCWVVHSNLAFALADAGLLKDATEQFRQTLHLRPDFADGYNDLGLTLATAGQIAEAVENYRQALRLRPDYADAHNNLGAALFQAGSREEAIEHYEQALRSRPDYASAHNNLGLALVNAGRVNEAIKHYEQALRLRPDFASAHNNLGTALVDLGRREEATEHYMQALQLNPDYAEAHDNLGLVLVDTGHVLEAIEHYERALRLKPDYVNAHNNLAVALAGMGQLSEAVKHYQQALRLMPGNAYLYFNLAISYSKMQQPSDAIEAAQKGLDIARGRGKQAQAKQIEDWLNSYRASLPNDSKRLAPQSGSQRGN